MAVVPRLPAPRTPDPRDAPPLRWGVIAPGSIAEGFAAAVRHGTSGTVAAAGSRSLERARAFVERHGGGTAYGSYEEVVADPAVDAVYVASPHSHHLEHALLAVEAGKPVLVEKAFTRNAGEARQVLAAADARGGFVLEAMWSRFLPHYDVVRQVVESGLLGELVEVTADHGQGLYPEGPARLALPALAGGALLDLGVYPVSFAAMVLGAVDSVVAVGRLTELGVDAGDTIVLRGATGAEGRLGTTMLAPTACRASVVGTRARLEVAGTFYQPTSLRLVGRDGEVLDGYDGSLDGEVRGLSFEAAEVARCLADGRQESPLLPWSETVRVMELLDEVRRQVGVSYPGE
ncbi:MAG TPA: Gfo/Idh/MocA family oxidoreductase [Intrasporangium sp.]|uniref:Gfo/Idh/MocA family protein n=1 Tax=Intrasporangium sp. TaxID=1925024 RepID=UPI002D79132E|nr:Gfo/Idh/MocA family oxidoreductase [Intrasporangium sp.]HET7398268.1 Gfo/Idh/MocA family oxidoreductase [Intrasporangium sp.]